MLRNDDVEAGVSAGLITRSQADGLWSLAAARRDRRRFSGADDERFRLIGGFNDVFIALGVILLVIGLMTLTLSTEVDKLATTPRLTGAGLILPFAVLIPLSDFLTKSRRLILPSIALASALCINAAIASWSVADGLFQITGHEHDAMAQAIGSGTPVFVGSLAAAVLFYWRYRLPFALFLTAGSLVATAVALLVKFAPILAPTILMPLVLVLGIGTFATAMAYDSTDPQRLTRRSDCAFWLHILSAPVIAHATIKWLATVSDKDIADYVQTGDIFNLLFAEIHFDAWTITLILCIFVLMSLIALVVDRRALLVSMLIYVGSVIAAFISSLQTLSGVAGLKQWDTVTFALPLVALGAIVIVLGTAWTPLRLAVVSRLPLGNIRNSIPPIPKTAQ